MKVAGYNIMSGGFNGYDYEARQPGRLSQLRAAIKEIDADVIGLVDTFRWNEIYTPQEIGELFGYEHVIQAGLDDKRLRRLGHDNGLAIMSKCPILEHEVIRLGTRNALRARVEQDGQARDVVVVYFDDLSKDVRLNNATALIARVADLKRSIVIGDLNTDPEPNPAAEEFCGQHSAAEPIIREAQDGAALNYLYEHGLQDAGRDAGRTFPTEVFPAAVAAPFLRLDYGLHGSEAQATDFVVHDGPVFQRASDHLPVSFTVV